VSQAGSPCGTSDIPCGPPVQKAFATLTGRENPRLVFELCVDRTEVGRLSPGEGINPQIDLSAADTTGSVSRRHALITREESFVVLEDRGSSNGTFVNGARLAPGLQKNLEDNDEICFGSLAFRFHRK